MKILSKLYSVYVLLCFSLLFLLLFPFFMIAIQINNKGKAVFFLNRVWARLLFVLIAMPNRYVYKARLDKRGTYIFCANHFSYFDIPVLGKIPFDAAFVGKSSLAKIPLFGYMFDKIHLSVNRENARSGYALLDKAKDVLDKGKSLIFFPEGGIWAKNPPEMARFKDGAFRLAIEKQISIVPVTIPYNWIILPDDNSFSLHWHKSEVIFHEPISTQGLTSEDLPALKKQIYDIIDSELKRKAHENR